MTTSRTLGIATLALTALLMLVGCGSEASGPSGGSTTGEATSGQSDGSSNGSTTPTDWQEVKVEAAQVHLPPDWTIIDQDDTSASFGAAKDELGLSPGGGSMTTGVNSPSGNVEADIERATEFHLETFSGDANLKNVKRLSDVTINGVHFSHIQWELGSSWKSEYVTVTPDGAWVITIGWGFTKSGLDRKGSQDLIDPVMATFEFR